MSALAPTAADGREFTPEQAAAIARRSGNLLLDASAGSGKTTVLVERYVRSIVEDGLEPAAILAITFTEKAAAELRERIRRRLWDAGAVAAARAADGASISTIHAFCARLLRAHALAAGLDPAFQVLDEAATRRLAARALERALGALADDPPVRDAIAGYGADGLRESILAIHRELRARGALRPALPEVPPPPTLEPLRAEFRAAGAALAAELGELDAPAVRVREALDRLAGCGAAITGADPWPGELDALVLPRNGGAALATPACERYRDAWDAVRSACAHRRAVGARAALEAVLERFGAEFDAAKRAAGALDFEDLELRAAALVRERAAVRHGLRERYARVMVDELQDTNAVQLELVTAIGDGRLFTVGDAQQAIYGFRHADVELFEALGERRERAGERLTLATNFRTRPELIATLNRAFGTALGERFRPLQAGRPSVAGAAAAEVPVELHVADRDVVWEGDGLAAGWRLAEARALAARVRELIDRGAQPRDVVVLTRATTDLRAYERALEAVGVPTYLIGGRGYWSHPQVVDLVALLRALANPRDEEALLTTLACPAVGLSLSGLVVLAAAAAAGDGELAGVALAPAPAGMTADDAARLERFAGWFTPLRADVGRHSVAGVIERAVCAGDYDLAVLRMPGGVRRMANLRKLTRLAREYEREAGPDLRGFLDEVAGLATEELGGGGDPRESEAPVEGEALDAVRLMTIHRSKGLEFEIVCVADLGRAPARSSPIVRVGEDGRLGISLAAPGGGRRAPALAFEELGERARARADAEERRLFYVAMTRARERLLLSGAARFGCWAKSSGPIAWIGPAFCPEVEELAAAGGGTGASGVRVVAVAPPEQAGQPDAASAPQPPTDPGPADAPAAVRAPEPPAVCGSGLLAVRPAVLEPPAVAPPPAPATVSYTSLALLQRCGYRFYAERVLGLPPLDDDATRALLPGTLLHRALERVDFRRPVLPPARTLPGAAALDPPELDRVDTLLAAFAASALCRRLAGCRSTSREQRFALPLDELTLTGAFDVVAEERPGELLVVDYKSDRLGADEPETALVRAYGLQRSIYALAALRTGARRVEVIHAFLEAADRPAAAAYDAGDLPALEAELRAVCEPVRRGGYRVAEDPHRRICAGCPAEGTLCSWPTAMTRRTAADQLF